MRGCSVFAMPSIHETFGLVYIEALSQNLPVLYTKGQGIDGIFDDTVGVGVNALSVEDIAQALKLMLERREQYGNSHVDFTMFDWRNIAKNYIDSYRTVKLS